MGVIIRTAAEGASEDAIVRISNHWSASGERINAKREEFWQASARSSCRASPDVAIRVVRDIFNDDSSASSSWKVTRSTTVSRNTLTPMAPDLKDKLEKWDPAEHEGKGRVRTSGPSTPSCVGHGASGLTCRPAARLSSIAPKPMTTIDVNTGRFIGKGKSLKKR